MSKRIEYRFSDIIYIDEAYSRQHKMLSFYLKDGKEHLLAFDKNGLIFEECLTKCKLMSSEDFAMRYKKVKL